MSYQYPLPAGYPPPGATYAMNQPSPNQAQSQGGDQPSMPQNYYPPPMPGVYPSAQPGQPQPPYNPGYGQQSGYPQGQGQGQGYYSGGASYSTAQIPTDGSGFQPGPLPYQYQPARSSDAEPGGTQQGGQTWPAPPPPADSAVIASEINNAAELMRRRQEEEEGRKSSTSSTTDADSKRVSTSSANMDKRTFYIVSEFNNKCVLDVRGDNPKPGTAVGLWKKKKDKAPNQLWYIGEDGFVRSKLNDCGLIPHGSDKELQTSVMTGDPRQQWMFEGNRIVNKVFTTECITLKKGLVRIRDDAEICAAPYEGKPIQHWSREYVD